MFKSSSNNLRLNHSIIKRLEESLISIQTLYSDCLIEVSVFGSYSKGTAHKYSSVDILVIVECSDERFVKRNANLQRILNESDEMPMVDPLVYTEEEIMELIKKKESFIDSMLSETIVVWNNFNEIDLNNLTLSNSIPSRYLSASPKLEQIKQ